MSQVGGFWAGQISRPSFSWWPWSSGSAENPKIATAHFADSLKLQDRDLAKLGEEEGSFIKEGLLPPAYARAVALGDRQKAMELAREGKKGPFSASYGDPEALLKGARLMKAHPELARLYNDLKVGDLVVMAPHSEGSTGDQFVRALSQGSYTHAYICTSTAYPPEFIEAIGATGDQGDPSSNKVRRISAAEMLDAGTHYRVLRPASHLRPERQEVAVQKAIAFAEKQLGKPYDYLFNNDNGNSSFYCSSLAMQCYTKGANVEILLQKSPVRDERVTMLQDIFEHLKPQDRGLINQEVTRFLSADEPTGDRVARFIETVLPTCEGTRDLCSSPEQWKKLAEAAKGARWDGVGNIVGSVWNLMQQANFWPAMKLLAISAWRGLGYGDVAARWAGGPQSKLATLVEALYNLVEIPRAWVGLRKGEDTVLPGRVILKPLSTLSSPTDLAEASVRYKRDYNPAPKKAVAPSVAPLHAKGMASPAAKPAATPWVPKKLVGSHR